MKSTSMFKEQGAQWKRLVSGLSVLMLLVSAVFAAGLNSGTAGAASHEVSAGSTGAKKKSKVVVTATSTVTGATVTATSTRQATGTREPKPTHSNSKVNVCHRTGSQSNPYVLLSVSESALAAHQQHGDLYPAPQGGCPQGTPRAQHTPRPTKTARPAMTATVQAKVKEGKAGTNDNKGNGNADKGSNNGNAGQNGNNGNRNNGNGAKKGKP